MSSTKTKKTKAPKSPATQNPEAATPAANQAQESRPTKKATTRPGKKVVSLIVDERWAARVALCARALGKSQTQYIVDVVSKNLKANLAAALDALKAEADVES